MVEGRRLRQESEAFVLSRQSIRRAIREAVEGRPAGTRAVRKAGSARVPRVRTGKGCPGRNYKAAEPETAQLMDCVLEEGNTAAIGKVRSLDSLYIHGNLTD